MTTQQGELGGDGGSVELRGKVKWFNAVKGMGFWPSKATTATRSCM